MKRPTLHLESLHRQIRDYRRMMERYPTANWPGLQTSSWRLRSTSDLRRRAAPMARKLGRKSTPAGAVAACPAGYANRWRRQGNFPMSCNEGPSSTQEGGAPIDIIGGTGDEARFVRTQKCHQ